MKAELIKDFIALVGTKNAISNPDDIAPYLQEPRGLYHGKTSLILCPNTTEQLAEIMRLAYKTVTPIVPQGGNSGVVGGQQPDESGNAIIISMARMNKIRHIDTIGNFAIVEAGVILQNLQQEVEKAERFFPLSLASEGTCQIGGNLSTNAGGTAVLRYGNSRELCMGLEVVLPDGRILNDFRFVKKDNTGYDLKNLFIGAEGTLGIITAAVMKIFPKPQGKSVAFVGLDTPEQAIEILRFTQNHAQGQLTGFELIAKLGMEISLNYSKTMQAPLSLEHDWYVLIELSAQQDDNAIKNTLEKILEIALQKEIIADAVIAQNISQQQQFWQLRENMSPAQKLQGGSIKHDISVPIAAIPNFIKDAAKIVDKIVPNSRVVCFGHLGDGNLHYNISQPIGADKQEFLQKWAEMNHAIHQLVMQYNGSFSAEHGIGQLKRKELAAFKPEIALQLMRDIKKIFDPKNIMNPHKIL